MNGPSVVRSATGGDSRRALETLLSNLPGMAYRCRNDRDWTMEFVSDGCLALTGCSADDLVENRSISYGSLVHPDDAAAVWEQVQAALASDQPFQVTYRLVTASGAEKWVWEQGRAVGVAEDGTLVIEGLVMDITEQRRLEEGIGASERKFRALYESANDAIFLLRQDAVIVDCNRMTEEIFGGGRDEILGERPHALSPEFQPDGRDSAEKAREKIRSALDGTRQRFDWKHRRMDGTLFDAEVSISAVEIDDQPAVLAIVRDVTERVQAYELLEQRVAERTEELRVTEERYRSLFERSRDAIFIAVDARFVDANQAALDMLGAQRSDVIGRPVDDFLGPGERVRLNEAVEAAGGAVKDFEVAVRRLDGARRDCLLTAHSREVEGATRGFEGIARDITEWKQTEEELFEQTRESAVLDERNRMAREIHDTLAQGFTGIVLQLEAAEQAAESDDEDVPLHVGRAKALARESLQEARRSVWDLAPQVLQEADLVAALEAEVSRFTARGAGRAKLTVSGPPRPLPRGADVALLRICQEALMNVRKYARASEVRVGIDYGNEAVSLTVEDDGAGFEPSLAAAAGASGRLGGFGLTSMEQRAQQYGGRLIVESAIGQGTRVEVVLPV